MKVQKKLWTLFNIIFSIIFLIIIIGTIFDNQAVLKKGNCILLLISMIITLLIWFLLFKFWKNKEINDKTEKKFVGILMLIIIAIQLFCSYQLAVNPSNQVTLALFMTLLNL